MADKTQFRTIETDEEELNTKIRKHRLKIIKMGQFIPTPMMKCTGTRPMR